MAVVLKGQDSVDAAGMQAGQDVYCGYGGLSAFNNIAAVESRFPGKKYVVIDTHVSQVDCYDIESGGGSASNAPVFFRQWRKVNTDKPVFYASLSVMPSVISALNGSGIARSSYYLWVAAWNSNSSIPSGYDGHQYANHPSYDSDSFYDYMWGTAPPPPPPPASSFTLGVNGAGVPGAWKQVNATQGADGVYVVTGTGTDGNVYTETSTDGVTWTRVSWPF